jgi:hypothetical protein
MRIDAKVRSFWCEEFALVAILLVFFTAIVALACQLPFDARLFPLVIGTAGILLTLTIAFEQVRRWRAGHGAIAAEDDAAGKADWPRYATALLSAPVFGLLFWLFGFVFAALAAMLFMPTLMGYRDRGRLAITALVTVAIVGFIAPYLLNVDLPNGLVGDWLKLTLRPG